MQIAAMKKDDFYRQMFKLTIPIIIQNLLSAAVNSADVIMLNYVGQSAISAVSLASNFSNVLFMVYYGQRQTHEILCQNLTVNEQVLRMQFYIFAQGRYNDACQSWELPVSPLPQHCPDWWNWWHASLYLP